MKAIVYTKYGSPDVLELIDVEKPVAKENEVLVRIHATTVNRTDCGFLRGKPIIVRFFSGLVKPKKTILGNEFAGEIVEIGKNTSLFKVGEKVFGQTGDAFGAHAQYIAVPEGSMLATLPENLTFEEAAPATEGAHYALNNIRSANVRQGQRVLIIGGTGAIGTAAIQLSKYFGAEVTATANTKNVDMVGSLGADSVIDYTKEDFTSHAGTYDFVFDAVGKSSFGACGRLLKSGGIFCATDFGPYFSNPLLAIVTFLFGCVPWNDGKRVIFPIPKENKEQALFIKERIEKGQFKPVIDKRYHLKQITDAFKYVETGHKTGNVVIIVGHNE